MSTSHFLVLGLPLVLIYFALRNSGTYFADSSLALTGGAFYLCFLAILAIFKLYVYPFYFSPLRHLPEPKASYTARSCEVNILTYLFRVQGG